MVWKLINPNIMENRILFLDKDGNVKNSEALSLEELQASYQSERFGSKSFTKPLVHFEFIDKVLNLMVKENVGHVMKKIFINKRDIQLIRKKDELVPMTINNLSVERLVGRILFPVLANDQSEYSLAYGYSDKGYELAFGLNVKVCSNLTIYSSKIYRTFGPNRMTIEEIMTRLVVWFRNLDIAWGADNLIMNELMNIVPDDNFRHQLISEIFYRSLKSAEGDPFNQGEAKTFALNMMEEPVENMWDVYNFGTRILHPKNIGNTERVLSMNEAFGLYLLGKFPELSAAHQLARDKMENLYQKSIS